MSAVAVEWFDAFDGFDAFGVSSPVAGAADDARTVELLAEVEPGVLAMNLLRGLDVERLDELQRIEVAAAWERQQAWVAAQAQLALAALVSDLPRMPVAEQIKAHEFRKDMIAACLRWSPIAAGNKLAVAERLVSALPLTLAALEGGQISFRHAFVLADAVDGLLPDEVAAVEARVIEKAGGQTVAQFTRSVRRAVLAAAPQLAAARHAQAVDRRDVRLIPGLDGMADVVAHLPAADATTVYEALDGQARKALAAAKQAVNDDPAAPRRSGSEPTGPTRCSPGRRRRWPTPSCRAGRAAAPRCRSSSTCPPCSGWPTIRAN